MITKSYAIWTLVESISGYYAVWGMARLGRR